MHCAMCGARACVARTNATYCNWGTNGCLLVSNQFWKHCSFKHWQQRTRSLKQDRRFKKEKQKKLKQKISILLLSIARFAMLLLHIIHINIHTLVNVPKWPHKNKQTNKTSEPSRSKSLPNVYDVPEWQPSDVEYWKFGCLPPKPV